MTYTGLHTHRFEEHPAECIFANEWDHLLKDDSDLRSRLHDEIDMTIACTFVQWLGSPVGGQWLERVLAGMQAPEAYLAAFHLFNTGTSGSGPSHLDELVGGHPYQERALTVVEELLRWFAGSGNEWLRHTFKFAFHVNHDLLNLVVVLITIMRDESITFGTHIETAKALLEVVRQDACLLDLVRSRLTPDQVRILGFG